MLQICTECSYPVIVPHHGWYPAKNKKNDDETMETHCAHGVHKGTNEH